MIKPRFLKTIAAFGVTAACAFSLAACTGGVSGGTAATVNGTAISEDDVTNSIEAIRKQSGLEDNDTWGQYLAAYGYTPETVREEIINSLADEQLVKQGAQELGVTVESSEVDTYVESMKVNFDSDEAWVEALTKAGFTEESYRESLESSLLSQAVEKYFEEKAEVSDDDILETANTYVSYYDGAKRSSHILFKVDDTSDEAAMEAARAEAQDVLNQINSGMDFEEAAKNYSDDSSAEDGGDVGWDKLTSFVTEYQDALDELDKGGVSGLVESQYGIHIIKCTDVFNAPEEITDMAQLPEALQDTIKSMAASTAASADYDTWLNGLRENAEIVINDMPSNVPYNVDMSKYTGSDEGSSDDAGDGDDAESGNSESDSGTESDNTENGGETESSGEFASGESNAS